jgi:putative CocE/NonD family hydrolase
MTGVATIIAHHRAALEWPPRMAKEAAMDAWRGAPESADEYGVLAALEVMLPMRDGVRLATDLYFPALLDDPGARAPGVFPVLLVRTPYNKRADAQRDEAEYFARRGYVVAIQDCRGRYRSEGMFYFLAQEPEDGYDTIEWLGTQPWSSGKVGTHGTSYLGWTQTAAAVLNPPHLAAMVVNQAGANAYTSSVRHNGALELRFLAWAFMEAATHPSLNDDLPTKLALQGESSLDWLRRLPWRPGLSPLARVPSVERWALDLLTRGDYDEFWEQPGFNFARYWDAHADVPLLLSGAWYDSYTRATLENFVGLSERKRGPVRLLMGPWTHGLMDISYAGDVELGPTAPVAGNLAESFDHLHLRWFDHWLKGLDNGVDAEPAARYFVMGDGGGATRRTPEGRLWRGGEWRAADTFPLPTATPTAWHLHADGALSPNAPREADAGTTFRYDPANPVPTVGGNISSLADAAPLPAGLDPLRIPYESRWTSVVAVGGQDQRDPATGAPLAARPDVLVFQSAPLDAPIEVTGPLSATLYVSSSAPDTDVTVKLVDVFPPSDDYPLGYALNISDSIFRLRYRDSFAQPQPLQPGEVYEVTIPMYGTSAIFGRGHRVRVDISGSNFPRFDLNPNTGEPIGRQRRAQVADTTIHHDAAHPSRIVLPVMAAEAASS